MGKSSAIEVLPEHLQKPLDSDLHVSKSRLVETS